MTAVVRGRRRSAKDPDAPPRQYNQVEKAVTRDLVAFAQSLGFYAFHDNDPLKNVPGWPDVHLLLLLDGLRPGDGWQGVFELKTPENRHPSPAQRRCLAGFHAAGVLSGVVRTTSWQSGEFPRFLQAVRAVGRDRVRGVRRPYPTLASLEVPPDYTAMGATGLSAAGVVD